MKAPGPIGNPSPDEINKLHQRITELEVLENEHKQKESELRESKDRLKIILDSVQTGIVIIDSETHRIVDANPFVSKLIGAPKERIIGSLCHQYICPAEEGRCPITDLGQTVDNAERVLLTAGGGRCPVIKTVEPVILGGRKHLLESFFDITERRRGEEALREREERYRTLLETMEEGYFEVDLKGNFSFVNDSLCKMVRASSKDQLVGLNNREYMDKETARKVYKIFNQVYNSGQPVKLVEYEIMKRDGKKIFQESSIHLMRNAQGEPTGFRGIMRDVTERKQAEEAFRRSEEEAKRLAQEEVLMAEIGRIISSTLNIEEVYERFAAEARKLIPFDRIMVALNNLEEGTATVTYASGWGFTGRGIGDVYPLSHSGNEEVLRTRGGLLVQPDTVEELEERFSALIPTFQAGLRSMMSVPLLSRGQVIGALHLRSKKSKAYTDRDLSMAERIAAQIAGAIANAQLYLDLTAKEATATAEKRKAEELEALNQQLRASEQRLRASEQQLKASKQQLEAKEQALQKSQTQLMEKLTQVEGFNKIMVGRELKMIELKEEINSLLEEMGKPQKYLSNKLLE